MTVPTMSMVGHRPNLLDPAFYIDPWDGYQWLLREAPVYWDPIQRLWGVTRYDDVVAVEKDSQRYSSFSGSRPHIDQSADESMINLDEPAHQAQRGLVAKRFTPNSVRSHADRVRDIVTVILDDVVAAGECEAIDAIASRLPAMMIGEVLGYAPDDWESVRHWSEQLMLLSSQTSPDGPPHTRHPDMAEVYGDYARRTGEIIRDRAASPQDDLISTWVHADGWTTQHVLDETLLVLSGGAETTRTVIGTIIRELALQPDQRQLLIDRPELLGESAVEEFIRWVSPVLNMRRTATVDHELHGQQIRRGDEVLLMYAAANRDPRVFDDPDVFDVTRQHSRHVAFGFGSHFCLGAHLARLEIRVMFEEMFKRMPDWELVDPDEPKIVPATFTRAYDQIRIRWTPEVTA